MDGRGASGAPRRFFVYSLEIAKSGQEKCLRQLGSIQMLLRYTDRFDDRCKIASLVVFNIFCTVVDQ